MCGLAGIARLGSAHGDPDAFGVVGSMVDAVAHRGPDEQAYSSLPGPVRLGFTRLSLVDLATGGQPLVLEDESLLLIANGEIYNHAELEAALPSGTRMRTRSDCEVLLHLYRQRGERFLDDVRGMFSLVLWDRRANTLVMARDRFGIKPLFFHRNADRVAFASEVKALFEDPATPRAVDWERALGDQLLSAAPRFSEEPLTSWFGEIVLVPTGSVLTFDLATGDVTTHRYWDLPEMRPDDSWTAADFVDEYRSLLESSVRDCEMADVEIGLFLSGGIDSAAIAALTRVGPHCFSALNAGTFANGDTEYSARIATALGLPNHQILFDASAVPAPDQWLRFVWQLETPLAGAEAFYKHEMYRYVAAARPSVKAMMLGAGADEFNGGYSTVFAESGWDEFAAALHSLQLRDALDRRPDLAPWWGADGSLVRTSKLRDLAGVAQVDPYEAFVRWKYRDVQLYNCWHEDRTAAASGIEARVPFLDHRLVELAATIPAHLRGELLWNKQILRRAVADVLDPEYVDRPKVPFFFGPGVRQTYQPFAAMLLANGGEVIERAVSGPSAREFLDPDAVRATALAMVDDPVPSRLELLLRVLNLGLLEHLAGDLPAHPHRAHQAPVPQRVVIGDWATDAADVARSLGVATTLDPDTVAFLDESVLLLRGDDASTEWFVAVNGEIQFVVDEIEDAAWLAVLRGLDGERTLGAVAGGAEAVAALEPLLAEAVGAGLLRLARVADRTPEPVG